MQTLKDNWGYILFLLIIGLLAGYIIFLATISTYGSTQCKELGYRTSTLGFPNTIYCETRENQTDKIILLDELTN